MSDPVSGIVAANRIAVEKWGAAFAKVKSSIELTRWVATRRQRIDGWIALPRERADLVTGWIHDYVNPITGVPMRWTENSPEPAYVPGDDRVRQAWATYIRQQNISYTLEAARMFRLTGDHLYAEWAMRQLDFYAHNYAHWPIRTVKGRARIFKTGLNEAVNSFPLVDAARLLADTAAPERRKSWEENLFRPMAESLKTIEWPTTNVALWHSAAIAAIAMRLHDSELLRYALDSSQGVRAMIAYGLTPDNVWIEGSFAYNAYVIECLSKLLVQASLEGYAAQFSSEWDVARRMLLSSIDYRFDDGSLPTPGDATVHLLAVDPAVHFNLYRLVPTYYAVARANAKPSWDAIIDPPINFPRGEPTLPPVQTRNFPSVRMAVLRSGEWQAFIHYGQAAASHTQQEALNYELHNGKVAISTDPGTVLYSSPYHLRYFRHAAAHNVPMVDGAGQSRWAPGNLVSYRRKESQLSVAHPAYQPGVAVVRTYKVTGAGFNETTDISVKGAGVSRSHIGAAFHTDCVVRPAAGLITAPDIQLPNSGAINFWNVQSRFTAGPIWSVDLTCGQQRYRMRVIGDGAQRVFIASAPTTPLPTRNTVVYYDVWASGASFQTEITAIP